MSIIFRQLFDAESSTYTYILGDSHEAILIDPVLEQMDRDLRLLSELDLKLKWALDTHVHADHLSALGALREKTNCKTGLSHHSGAECPDVKLKEGSQLQFGKHMVETIETPGHTKGCLTYQVGSWLFTGDALMIRTCGRTDFQGGNAETLYHSVVDKLFQFSDETLVYPAHDYKGMTVSTIGEERHWNPRFKFTPSGFVEFMRNLKLTDPKKMMAAVPANMHCGQIPRTGL